MLKRRFFRIFLEPIDHFYEQKRKWVICTKKQSYSLICSFVLIDLSELVKFIHLSWATWVMCSQSLICPEQPEQIAHICLFVLSDLSKWANARMSEWAIEQKIPNPAQPFARLAKFADFLELKSYRQQCVHCRKSQKIK